MFYSVFTRGVSSHDHGLSPVQREDRGTEGVSGEGDSCDVVPGSLPFIH